MSNMEDVFGLSQDNDQEEEEVEVQKQEEEKKIEGPAPHLVESFCAAMSRMALGQKLYSSTNKLLVLMRERVEDSWTLINANGEGINLDLNDGGAILYHEIVVFQQEGRDTIASKLYEDGIRRLSFAGNMDPAEIFEFLKIFDRNQEWQAEADTADRLWILQLKGIKYQAVDGFEELVKQTRGDAQGLAGAALAQMTGEQGGMAKREGREGQEKAWGPTRRHAVDSDGMYVLFNEIEQNGDDDTVHFWLEDKSPTASTFERFQYMTDWLIRHDGAGLNQGEIDTLLQTMFRQQLITDDGDMVERIEGAFDLAEPVGSAMKRAWREVVEPELFTELLIAEDTGTPRHKALTTLMERYLNPTPEQLVASVVANPDIENSGTWIDMLDKMEDDPLSFWGPHLSELPVPIVLMIAKRMKPGDERRASGKALLDVCWASNDADLQVLANTLTPGEWMAPHKDALQRMLEDPVEEVRLTSSAALRRLGDATAGIYILNLLRRSEEKSLNPTEIRSLLHTLMHLGGDRYVPWLEQCLGPLVKPNKGVFGFGKRSQIGHINPIGDGEALRALVRHGSPKALAVVKEAFQNGSPQLKSFIGVVRNDPEADMMPPEPEPMPEPPSLDAGPPSVSERPLATSAPSDSASESGAMSSGRRALKNLSGFLKRKQ